ncbi:hypothetical protein BASA81_002067 [Batrachochytrium salamandrivorans]|nr:hypothetical protein BASA81_002067 [Batrachochytrium salamandrivorans]
MESLALLIKAPGFAPKLIKSVYDTVYDDSIYSGRYVFKVPPNNGRLVQQYVKATVDVGHGDKVKCYNLLKFVRLLSEERPLQTMDEMTITTRINLLADSSLYHRMLPGINGVWKGGNVYEYTIPLFWFFSDLPEDYLDSTSCDFRVEIVTNPTPQSMTSAGEFHSVKYELFSYFKQVNSFGPKHIPKQITSSYDSFIEKPVPVSNGATSVRILLTCPSEVFNVIFSVVNKSNGLRHAIDSVKIDCPTSNLFDLDVAMNYLISEKNNSVDWDSILPVRFGPRHDPKGDFVKFSQSMGPTYATLTFKQVIGNDYVLYAVCEYRSNIAIDSQGRYYQDLPGMFNLPA